MARRSLPVVAVVILAILAIGGYFIFVARKKLESEVKQAGPTAAPPKLDSSKAEIPSSLVDTTPEPKRGRKT